LRDAGLKVTGAAMKFWAKVGVYGTVTGGHGEESVRVVKE
jgi:hypothetical protein